MRSCASLNMALAIRTMLWRRAMSSLRQRGRLLWTQALPSASLHLQLPQLRAYSTETDPAKSEEPVAFDTESRFKEKPWEYLETEEYIEKYGNNPVWFGYRRNHRGSIGPQKTRKKCIRGAKVSRNACPICRDQKLHVDYRNVKLLDQFICQYTGDIYHATYTGVCMKQYKHLIRAIEKSRDYGLLSFPVPYVELEAEDYNSVHQAVSKTPLAPALQNQAPWYPWYAWQQPPDKEIARIRRIYKNYLKEETSPA